MEDHARGHFFVRVEEAKLARVVEGLEDLRVEVYERVRDVRLTLLRLRPKKCQIADIHGHLERRVILCTSTVRQDRSKVPREDQVGFLGGEHVLVVDLDEAVE